MMKKLLSLLLATVLLAGACLIVPVSAEETDPTDLSENLVVHYDFNSVGAEYASEDYANRTLYDIPDVAPGGDSDETLMLVSSNGSGKSYVKDGYMHIDSMKSTSVLQNMAVCFFDTETGIGSDIQKAESFTIMWDMETIRGDSGTGFGTNNFSDFMSLGHYSSSSDNSYLRCWKNAKHYGIGVRTILNNSNTTVYAPTTGTLSREIYALVGNAENNVSLYCSNDGGKSFDVLATNVAISANFLSDATSLSLGGMYLNNGWKKNTDSQNYGIDFNFYDFRFYNTVLTTDQMTSELSEQETGYYGTQYKEFYTPEGSDTNVYDARLIATIDAAKSYDKAGFKVYTDDGTNQYDLSSEVTCHYAAVYEWSETESKMVEKAAPDGRRFIVLVVEGIPEGTYPTITVIPWGEVNGKTVYANPTVITVAANDIPVLNG